MTAIQRLRRALAAVLVVLAATTATVAGGLAATAGTAHAAEFPGGELLNPGSGLCLAGDGSYSGFRPNPQDPLQEEIYPCTTVQDWVPEPLSGQYNPTGAYKVVDGNGSCPGVKGGSLADGAPVEWEPCGLPGDAQTWMPLNAMPADQNHSYTVLVNVNSGKCLGVYEDSIGAYAVLVQEPCTGVLAQRWVYQAFTSTKGTYVNDNSGMCLTEVAADTDLVQAPCTVTGLFSTPIPGQLWVWSQSNLA